MSCRLLLAFVAILVGLSSTPAHADRLLIAAGAKNPADAQAALLSLVVPKALKLPANTPRIVKSDDIPGLNPGFHIVVVGQCKDAARAAAALDVLRVFAPGAYVKDIKASAPDSECPTVDGTSISARMQVKEQAEVRKGVGAVQWAIVEVPSQDKDPACRIPALRMEVRHRRLVLAATDESPLCAPGDGGEDLGMSTTPSASLVPIGDHTFVQVSRTTWAGDHSSTSAALYAFCADGITELLTLPGTMGSGSIAIDAITPLPDPGRPAFSVEAPGEPATRHRFVPERCLIETITQAAGPR